MSLVLTYAPKEDESGMGYYRRLAADNAAFQLARPGKYGGCRTQSSSFAHALGRCGSQPWPGTSMGGIRPAAGRPLSRMGASASRARRFGLPRMPG